MGGLMAEWNALIEESQTWGLDALRTLAALAVRVGRSFVDNPEAYGSARTADRYYSQLGDVPPKPYALWLNTVSNLLADGQMDGSVSPMLDCAAASRVIVASFYGIQDMSRRLNTRDDLLERINEWWETIMPVLADEDTRNLQAHAQGASSVA